jgi:hypothetical protein
LNDDPEYAMNTEILIIRDRDCYRVLHGHLHLASMLSIKDQVEVDVVDEGKRVVVKTRKGYAIGADSQPSSRGGAAVVAR